MNIVTVVRLSLLILSIILFIISVFFTKRKSKYFLLLIIVPLLIVFMMFGFNQYNSSPILKSDVDYSYLCTEMFEYNHKNKTTTAVEFECSSNFRGEYFIENGIEIDKKIYRTYENINYENFTIYINQKVKLCRFWDSLGVGYLYKGDMIIIDKENNCKYIIDYYHDTIEPSENLYFVTWITCLGVDKNIDASRINIYDKVN